jgi:hypothetical protein
VYRRSNVIDVTKMNGLEFTINADLIEVIEEVPDTVITLTTGKKIMVKESRLQIKSLVKNYKREIFTGAILDKDQ